MAEVARASARSERSGGPEVRDLASLSARAQAYNLGYLTLVWAVALGGVGLFWARPAWWTFVLAFVLVSSRQQALLNVEHECIHGIFMKGRRWNERLAILLCASPCASPFYATKARHLAHHRLLATDEDPDAPLHRGDDKSSRRGLVRHFVFGLLGAYALMVLFAGPTDDADRSSQRRDRRNVIVGQLGVLALFWALTDWWVYGVLWLAPLGTLTAAMHLVRSFCEHAIVRAEADVYGSRLISIRSNPLERFLVAPYNMNYHAEHQLFPWVPAVRLPELQRRLGADADGNARLVRRSYAGALAHYVRELA